jgi:Uma2 family endonuclease
MSAVTAEEKLVLGPGLAGIRLTPEEFDAVEEYDDLYRYELVDEVLVVLPFASCAVAAANDQLNYLLRSYRDSQLKGSTLDATIYGEYVRAPRGRRLADRVIWAGLGRHPKPRVDVPSIVVDFVTETKHRWLRDYHQKRDEYLAVGVLEYWLIDRFRRTLTIFRKQGNGWQEIVVHEHETYQTPLLPGFELPLAQLLAVADQWKE